MRTVATVTAQSLRRATIYYHTTGAAIASALIITSSVSATTLHVRAGVLMRSCVPLQEDRCQTERKKKDEDGEMLKDERLKMRNWEVIDGNHRKQRVDELQLQK